MNYFTIKYSSDIGNGYVLLLLTHDYGDGPEVHLPITGEAKDYPPGKRIQLTAKVVG